MVNDVFDTPQDNRSECPFSIVGLQNTAGGAAVYVRQRKRPRPEQERKNAVDTHTVVFGSRRQVWHRRRMPELPPGKFNVRVAALCSPRAFFGPQPIGLAG
jgi:hypothetical protein